ncbi:MAG: hypothetical protein LBE91_14365 [Tannerella sp.]|nr:hypothetical protein [Tannerella sp.]
MKRFILVLSLGLMVGFFNVNKSEAQVHISINIDIQPAWGPSGYDYAEFYYIPELNIYYDVLNQLFYYLDGSRWIRTMYLPVAYSYYDFYSLYKVVLNNILDPWRYNRNHIGLYRSYCYNYRQVPIFYMTDTRYYRARENYRVWVEPRYMPQDNGRPRSRNFSTNTRNGRISAEYRSASANTALRNSGNSRSTTVNRSSSSSRAGSSSSSSVGSSRSTTNRSSATTGARSTTNSSRASRPSASGSSSRESSSFSGNNDKARSTPITRSSSNNSGVSRSSNATRSSGTGVSSSRTAASRSSSSSVSTRSRSNGAGSSVSSSSSRSSTSRGSSSSVSTRSRSNDAGSSVKSNSSRSSNGRSSTAASSRSSRSRGR